MSLNSITKDDDMMFYLELEKYYSQQVNVSTEKKEIQATAKEKKGKKNEFAIIAKNFPKATEQELDEKNSSFPHLSVSEIIDFVVCSTAPALK